MPHVPVMLREVVRALRPAGPSLLLDCTVGAGGHARALLEAHSELRVVALDRDPHAVALARETLRPFGERVELHCARFSRFPEVLRGRRVQRVLVDLGVSSMQLDDGARGFSYQRDGPLDARMGQEGQTAGELLAKLDHASLAQLLRQYGEEPHADLVAGHILELRERGELRTTADLRRACEDAYHRNGMQSFLHPARLTFQALRMAVNDELRELSRLLDGLEAAAEPGLRLAALSFQALEQRVLDSRFARWRAEGRGGPAKPFRFRRAVSFAEAESNPRARSAHLHVFEFAG
jgi:16S rRNA (cytosine1402-N4)-methyltransferase